MRKCVQIIFNPIVGKDDIQDLVALISVRCEVEQSSLTIADQTMPLCAHHGVSSFRSNLALRGSLSSHCDAEFESGFPFAVEA